MYYDTGPCIWILVVRSMYGCIGNWTHHQKRRRHPFSRKATSQLARRPHPFSNPPADRDHLVRGSRRLRRSSPILPASGCCLAVPALHGSGVLQISVTSPPQPSARGRHNLILIRRLPLLILGRLLRSWLDHLCRDLESYSSDPLGFLAAFSFSSRNHTILLPIRPGLISTRTWPREEGEPPLKS